MNAEPRKKSLVLLLIIFLLIYGVVVLRNAWLCDDAYISLRTVDNFLHGYGLTWNVAERVQAYTHPLWVFLLIPFYAVTGEVYFTVLAVSIVLSLAAVAWFGFKIARSALMACLGIMALALSAAFVDFSTSGLENPLTFFLLALFLHFYFKDEANERALFRLSVIAALGAVNRLDTILLFLPMLVHAFRQVGGRRAVKAVIIGFTPLIAWEIFSLIYYGFPFPNTAYAKLNTGLDRIDVWTQGIYYIVYSLRVDPLTIIIIAGGILVPLVFRGHRTVAPVAAIILYLLYIVYIGGCFMSGRYLAAPLFIAVALLSQYRELTSKAAYVGILLVVLIPGLATGGSPLYAGRDDAGDPQKIWHGIVRERDWYNPTHGLLNYSPAKEWPSHHWIDEGKRARDDGLTFIPHVAVGMVGFYAGPQAYVLDVYAVTDPLLARLPVCEFFAYRVGHFGRIVPPGYKRTVITGQNHITDPALREYYDRLSLLTRGPLFSLSRFREIVEFNFGAAGGLVDRYTSPHPVLVDYEDIREPREEGVIGVYANNYLFQSDGLDITLGRVYKAGKIEISRDFDDTQWAVFCLGTKEVARGVIPSSPIPPGGLARFVISVPAPAVATGYDRITIVPGGRNGGYHSIGHLTILDK